MNKTYTWRIAKDSDLWAICALIKDSKHNNEWNFEHVQKRIAIPLFLEQLILFYNNEEKLCGFVTLGFLSPEAAEHQSTLGVQPNDWRSGSDLWVIDFFATDGGGAKMLRTLTSQMNKNKYKKVKYFRIKYKQYREVRP